MKEGAEGEEGKREMDENFDSMSCRIVGIACNNTNAVAISSCKSSSKQKGAFFGDFTAQVQ